MKHRWISRRAGGAPDVADSYEMVTYCETCGGEYYGDANEFPEMVFPCATFVERIRMWIDGNLWKLKRVFCKP